MSYSTHTNPRISIVTVCYNSAAHIEETLQSVINQGYKNLDYIIIDGGSTDGTLDIVQRYAEHIAVIVSEPDKGISDAFNKGIARATGDVIGIINSDDVMIPGSLEAMAKAFDGKTDVYRGNEIIWNPDTGSELREVPSMKFSCTPVFASFAHEASFITPEAYKRYGDYDLRMPYVMDADLFIRLSLGGATMKRVDADIVKFRVGGTTSTPLNRKRADYLLMARKNGASNIRAHAYYATLRIIDVAKHLLDKISPDLKRKIRLKCKIKA